MAQPHGFFQGKTVAELSRQVRNQEVRCVQLTQAALDAIHQQNPAINAFVSLNVAEALHTAQLLDREIDEGQYRGPLHGIPIAIKDNIDTRGMPTTYGSHLFQNHWPTTDARCVALLRAAGAVVVGKTLTSEFALGPTGEFSFQGPSHNPHDLNRVTGGSSAGSAAAVAGGMVPIAIGTDTAGSIRIPASFCGVVGFKPSYGRISLEGVYPVSATLDHVGPLAQCVEDIAILLEVLSGCEPGRRCRHHCRHRRPGCRCVLRCAGHSAGLIKRTVDAGPDPRHCLGADAGDVPGNQPILMR